MEPRLVERFMKLSLKNLGLGYVDLYLIHWPCALKYTGDNELLPADANGDLLLDPTTDLEEIWKEMENLWTAGRQMALESRILMWPKLSACFQSLGFRQQSVR